VVIGKEKVLLCPGGLYVDFIKNIFTNTKTINPVASAARIMMNSFRIINPGEFSQSLFLQAMQVSEISS